MSAQWADRMDALGISDGQNFKSLKCLDFSESCDRCSVQTNQSCSQTKDRDHNIMFKGATHTFKSVKVVLKTFHL